MFIKGYSWSFVQDKGIYSGKDSVNETLCMNILEEYINPPSMDIQVHHATPPEIHFDIVNDLEIIQTDKVRRRQ